MGSTKLLDHGSISVVAHWGSDERIIEAARMSTDKGFQGWGPRGVCSYCGYTVSAFVGALCPKCSMGGSPTYTMVKTPGDERLLKYLYDNKHATPFEMAGLVIEVQAPIFVFREWHRHRTQSYNEMSARYTPLPDMNYVPSIERLMFGGGTNK